MSTLYEMSLAAQNLLDLLTDEEIDEQTFNDTLDAIEVSIPIPRNPKALPTAEVSQFSIYEVLFM